MCSALVVPMLVEGRVEGLVSLFDQAPAVFDDRDGAILLTLAAHAGAAARNARLHARAGELAAGRERVRLASEIHDTLSQVLFSIGLKLDWCLHRLSGPPEVRARLEDIRHATGFTMAQVRTLIGKLTPGTTRAPTLGDRFGALLEQFRTVTGAAAAIVQRGEVDRLDPQQQDVVYFTLQEMLARVATSGPAARVVIRLEIGAAEAAVEVADEGSLTGGGDAPAGDAAELDRVIERLAGIGGRLEVTQDSPSGSRLRAAFPLR
jgi:signal transduction histidine kinase